MCLFKDFNKHKNWRPLIAKEDIICYKVLEYCNKDDAYYTPVQGKKVPNKCIQEKVPFKAPILNIFKFIWNHILGCEYFVEEGFIHTHRRMHKVFLTQYDCTAFKCIIPKGTLYYIGTTNDYASRQIIFLRAIDVNDIVEY